METSKIDRLKELFAQRQEVDGEIKSLKESLTAELIATLNPDRKPRKKRAPKQLPLMK